MGRELHQNETTCLPSIKVLLHYSPPSLRMYSIAECTFPPVASNARTFCDAFVKPMSCNCCKRESVLFQGGRRRKEGYAPGVGPGIAPRVDGRPQGEVNFRERLCRCQNHHRLRVTAVTRLDQLRMDLGRMDFELESSHHQVEEWIRVLQASGQRWKAGMRWDLLGLERLAELAHQGRPQADQNRHHASSRPSVSFHVESLDWT